MIISNLATENNKSFDKMKWSYVMTVGTKEKSDSQMGMKPMPSKIAGQVLKPLSQQGLMES